MAWSSSSPFLLARTWCFQVLGIGSCCSKNSGRYRGPFLHPMAPRQAPAGSAAGAAGEGPAEPEPVGSTRGLLQAVAEAPLPGKGEDPSTAAVLCGATTPPRGTAQPHRSCPSSSQAVPAAPRCERGMAGGVDVAQEGVWAATTPALVSEGSWPTTSRAVPGFGEEGYGGGAACMAWLCVVRCIRWMWQRGCRHCLSGCS